MHGAGLINAFFMKPGSVLVEILPCHFGEEHQRNYFWHPSHVEARTYAFQIYINNAAMCRPSPLADRLQGTHQNLIPSEIVFSTITTEVIVVGAGASA
jgi:hypothetical protein